MYIYKFLYKKCYQQQLHRRSIFTEQKGFTGCHIKYIELN